MTPLEFLLHWVQSHNQELKLCKYQTIHLLGTLDETTTRKPRTVLKSSNNQWYIIAHQKKTHTHTNKVNTLEHILSLLKQDTDNDRVIAVKGRLTTDIKPRHRI
jgi:hypothetical protein